MTVTHGEFVTFKHIKTRKAIVLEIEIPEERFSEVIGNLGMPIGGESKPVAIALLDKEVVVANSPQLEPTEGEKIRIKAIMLCKNVNFQEFCAETIGYFKAASEENAATYIKNHCYINSRSELATNTEAQVLFKGILTQFEQWKLQNQYKDNLDRI